MYGTAVLAYVIVPLSIVVVEPVIVVVVEPHVEENIRVATVQIYIIGMEVPVCIHIRIVAQVDIKLQNRE
jgi:hypothetical protein